MQLVYIVFILDIKHCFTCDESKLFRNVAKFRDIISMIVGPKCVTSVVKKHLN